MARTFLKHLSDLFKAPRRSKSKPLSFPAPGTLIYTLESPKLGSIKLNDHNRFSGFVFDFHDRPVDHIDLYVDERFQGRYPAGLDANDIFRFIPHIQSASNCRFDFRLHLQKEASVYRFDGVYRDRSTQPIFILDLMEIRSLRQWMEHMRAGLRDIPAPPGDLVFLTQGMSDSQSYQESIIPGYYMLKQYLSRSGVPADRLKSILDFGCGTGRLLVGWHLDDPLRRLHGCDINEKLIEWCRNHLPQAIDTRINRMEPVLPYPDRQFDLVYLLSVFTHLSLEAQKAWIAEFRRVLKPGGALLLSLHGETYVHIYKPMTIEDFRLQGYLEQNTQTEGSNACSTYHSHEFIKELFHGFDVLGFFERGSIDGRSAVYPVAAYQDVYVLRLR